MKRYAAFVGLLLALPPTGGPPASRRAVMSSSIHVDAPVPPVERIKVRTHIAPAPPELPRVFLNTGMPARTGRTLTVAPNGDLQRALDRAQPGDEIVLQAGVTYVGNFILPRKRGASNTPGTGMVIVVRTSGIAALPEGRRVTPGDSLVMARLMTPRNGAEVIGTAPGTAGWRLVGLEITAAPTVTEVNRLVRFGDGASTQSRAGDVPQNLVVDRSYVHAHPRLEIRRCIDLQSGASAVIDSYVSECHSTNGDAQAILSYNGPGPYKIVNNYLEGSGENLMIGGADISVPGQLPSDIEIRHNYFFKPLTWKRDDPRFAGTLWLVKNLFELKMGQRILVEGNVFENAWVHGQTGFALLLKTTNTQRFPTTDVTVRNNIIRGAAGGANVAGIDAAMYRITIENNLFLDIGTPRWGQNGFLFQVTNVEDLSISHNTGFATAMTLSLSLPTSPRLSFTSNVVSHGQYGVKASSVSAGTQSLASVAPAYVFAGNVLIEGGLASQYPAGTYFASSAADVGFADPPSDDFSLGSRSRFSGMGTGGTNPGIDHTALLRATHGAKP